MFLFCDLLLYEIQLHRFVEGEPDPHLQWNGHQGCQGPVGYAQLRFFSVVHFAALFVLFCLPLSSFSSQLFRRCCGDFCDVLEVKKAHPPHSLQSQLCWRYYFVRCLQVSNGLRDCDALCPTGLWELAPGLAPLHVPRNDPKRLQDPGFAYLPWGADVGSSEGVLSAILKKSCASENTDLLRLRRLVGDGGPFVA